MKDKEPTEELVVVDVSRYRKVKNALKDSEARYRSLFENMPIGIFRCSADGKILEANPALQRMLGFPSPAEAEQKNRGKNDKNLLKILREFCAKIESQNEFRSFDLTWRKKDNTPLSIRVNARMVSANNVLFYEGTIEEISERKRAETALRESEERYRAIFENNSAAMAIIEPDTTISMVNEEYCKMSGYTKQEVVGMSWTQQIPPEDLERLKEFNRRRLINPNDAPTKYEFSFYRKNGEIKQALMSIAMIHNNKIITSFIDISERKQSESQREAALEALQAALAGKEVLLKEVHHRVKNNLTAIIGILQLQREMVTDPAAVAQFKELEGRIRSMALVHETLYKSESLSRIDLQDYLEKLIVGLRAALAPGCDIRIGVAATGVEMGLDCAIPCGLILNELLTNACKYAFPGGQPRAGEKACKITVTAEWDGNAGDNGLYTLTVADNGVGLPVDLDWATTKTMGLRLVRMLGEFQLDGRVELDRASGTSFRLVFASRQREKG
jgi:PAS domain S-box-containing protein